MYVSIWLATTLKLVSPRFDMLPTPRTINVNIRLNPLEINETKRYVTLDGSTIPFIRIIIVTTKPIVAVSIAKLWVSKPDD